MTKTGILIPFLYLLAVFQAKAQYNMLDATFGNNGHVTTNYDSEYEAYGHGVAIQSDGKIVAVGEAYESGVGQGFALFRYLPNGILDTSFNHTGQIVYLPNGLMGGANTVVIQPDGKILAGGYVNNPGSYKDFALVRFMPNGSVDSSFGSNGSAITTVANRNDEISKLALHADGKIVAAGYANNSAEVPTTAMAQYHSNGMPDNNFSSDGKLTLSYNGYANQAYALAVQPNGKIIVGGYSNTGLNASFAVARFLPDGWLDTTFAHIGKTITEWSGVGFYDRIYGIAVWPDGKIIAAGKKDHQFGLIKYNENGALDLSFGNQGKLAFSNAVGGTLTASACDVTLTWDGKIVVAGAQGEITGTDPSYIVVGKFHPNGSGDNTFGNGGQFSIAPITSFDEPKNMALQSDGKIVISGTGRIAGDHYFLLTRFLPSFDMGILEFSAENHTPFIYPNPVETFFTLRYTLPEATKIHIELYDIQGRMIMPVLLQQQQEAGQQQIEIYWPQEMAAGNYYLRLSTPVGTTGIHIIKG